MCQLNFRMLHYIQTWPIQLLVDKAHSDPEQYIKVFEGGVAFQTNFLKMKIRLYLTMHLFDFLSISIALMRKFVDVCFNIMLGWTWNFSRFFDLAKEKSNNPIKAKGEDLELMNLYELDERFQQELALISEGEYTGDVWIR